MLRLPVRVDRELLAANYTFCAAACENTSTRLDVCLVSSAETAPPSRSRRALVAWCQPRYQNLHCAASGHFKILLTSAVILGHWPECGRVPALEEDVSPGKMCTFERARNQFFPILCHKARSALSSASLGPSCPKFSSLFILIVLPPRICAAQGEDHRILYRKCSS